MWCAHSQSQTVLSKTRCQQLNNITILALQCHKSIMHNHQKWKLEKVPKSLYIGDRDQRNKTMMRDKEYDRKCPHCDAILSHGSLPMHLAAKHHGKFMRKRYQVDSLMHAPLHGVSRCDSKITRVDRSVDSQPILRWPFGWTSARYWPE